MIIYVPTSHHAHQASFVDIHKGSQFSCSQDSLQMSFSTSFLHCSYFIIYSFWQKWEKCREYSYIFSIPFCACKLQVDWYNYYYANSNYENVNKLMYDFPSFTDIYRVIYVSFLSKALLTIEWHVIVHLYELGYMHYRKK